MVRRYTPLVTQLAIEEEQLAGAATDTNAGDGADSLETSLLEVNDEAAAGDETDAQVEEATDTAEALEDIADAMEVSAQNGGLPPEAADVVRVAVEHMYIRVGITKKPMPSLEAFGQTTSRQQGTRIALEDIKQQVKKIWEAIKAALRKAIEWAKGYYLKIFGAAENLGKRAEALRKRAEGTTTGTPKEKTVKAAGVAKALHVSGKVNGVPAAVDNLVKTATGAFKQTFESIEASLEAAITSTEANGEKPEFLTTGFELEAAKPPYSTVNPEDVGYGASSSDKVKFYRSEELPGGKAIIAYANDSKLNGEEGIQALRVSSTRVGPFDQKAEVKVSEEIGVLSAGDCVKVSAAIVTLASELKAFRNKTGKIEAVQKKAMKAADALASKADKSTDAAVGKSLSGAATVLRSVTSQINQLPASLAQYSLVTGKAALDLVELSLKQYTDK